MGIAGPVAQTVHPIVAFHGRGTSVSINWGAQPVQYTLAGRIKAGKEDEKEEEEKRKRKKGRRGKGKKGRVEDREEEEREKAKGRRKGEESR